jgi:hypothetical protein
LVAGGLLCVPASVALTYKRNTLCFPFTGECIMAENVQNSPLQQRLSTIGLAPLGILWMFFIGAFLVDASSNVVLSYAFVLVHCAFIRAYALRVGFLLMLCWAAFWGAYDVLQVHWAAAILLGVPVFPIVAVDTITTWVSERFGRRRAFMHQ